jgi:putative acetyltransferase
MHSNQNPRQSLQIRAAEPGHTAGISQLITAAFSGMPHADGDEAELVLELRAAGALPVSLVTLLDGVLVAYVAFSPARPADRSAGWYGLGPLAVLPGHQRKGIGSALLRRGLFKLKALGAAGCIVVGEPDYYRRFGFALAPGNAPATEPAEYFMLQSFGSTTPHGAIDFHPAFRHPDQPLANR